jgi:hypothetical protein
LVLILTTHSWDSHALISPASSAGPCLFHVVHVGPDYHGLLLFLVISLSRHLFTWARTVGSSDSHGLVSFFRFIHVACLPLTLVIILTWSLLLVATTTDCSCRSHVACCPLDWTPTDFPCSVSPSNTGLSIRSSRKHSTFRTLVVDRFLFSWLHVDRDCHGLSIRSSGPSGSCSPTPRLIHVVPVARCNYHGLFVHLF